MGPRIFYQGMSRFVVQSLEGRRRFADNTVRRLVVESFIMKDVFTDDSVLWLCVEFLNVRCWATSDMWFEIMQWFAVKSMPHG